MTIGKNEIEERKELLLSDIKANNDKISALGRALEESKQLNFALTGAVQQCDDFLQKLDASDNQTVGQKNAPLSEKSNTSSSIPKK